MILDAKVLKDAVAKCSAGIAAGVGLTQAGKVIFIPGYVMGCGTSINVRVPLPQVDISAMIAKDALDKILAKASGDLNISLKDAGMVVRHGRSRITLPCSPLPEKLPPFPAEMPPAPEDFIRRLKSLTFPNKTGYAGVVWDAAIYPVLLATDSVRIVTSECPDLPGAAWLPEAAVAALTRAGTVATRTLNDMPYIHVEYADGTICSVLYRAISDFPVTNACGYLQAYKSAPVLASAAFTDEILSAISEAEGFTDTFSQQTPIHIEFSPGMLTISTENASGSFRGEAPWDGEYVGRFTVDASPFRQMAGGVGVTLKNIDGANIILALESNGTTTYLSPDT